uniref:CX domain-containing protein n=1 Tax=Panagrellus redivivus TaxID=6233 RepID=A0A7E4V9T6_PANRE
MAAEPNAPWSRWDAPGFEYISPNTQPPIRQYDTGTYVGGNGNQSIATGVNYFTDGKLIAHRPKPDDPAYIECVYQAASTGAEMVQTCFYEFGCCKHKCCEHYHWGRNKGMAIALICIVLLIMVLSVIIWFLFWLYNRSKDKRQRQLIENNGMTPETTHESFDAYSTGVPPPYIGGPPMGGPPMGGPPPPGAPYYPPQPQPYGAKPYQY